jgi:predicted outer membrane protein
MLCRAHGVEFAMPFGCPECTPALAKLREDDAGDHDVRSATTEGLPTLRDHERWMLELATDARRFATNAQREDPTASSGPAYMRVSLSARIEAAKMADNRERRAWALEIERARAKSGSRAATIAAPSKPHTRIGDASARERNH